MHGVDINQSFSLRGEWWDEPNPELKFAGELSYQKRKPAQLVVSGIFAGWGRGPRGYGPDPVLGETYAGECVTVINPYATKVVQTPNPKGSTTTVQVIEMLVGPEHVRDGDNSFFGCTIELSGTTQWLRRRAFERSDDGLLRRELEAIEVPLPSIGGKMKIWAGGSEQFCVSNPRLIHQEVITIELDEPRNYSFFRQLTYDLSVLCGLLTGKHSNINRVSLHGGPLMSVDGPPNVYEYIFHSPKGKYSGSKSHYLPHFEWDFLRTHSPDLFNRWLALPSEKMSVARSVHHSRCGNAKIIETKLLAIAAGLESLGSDMAVDKLVPETEWVALKRELHNVVESEAGDEIKDVLTQKISSMNGRSLHSVIEKILDSMSSEASGLVRYGDDEYAAKFVKTRNALVHPAPEETRTHRLDMSKNPSEIVRLIEITEHLILHNVLVRLGVPEDYLVSRYLGGSNLSELFNSRADQ